MTFEEFAAARLPALVRYAAVLTVDREQARDIVQTALARAPGPGPSTSTCLPTHLNSYVQRWQA